MVNYQEILEKMNEKISSNVTMEDFDEYMNTLMENLTEHEKETFGSYVIWQSQGYDTDLTEEENLQVFTDYEAWRLGQ